MAGHDLINRAFELLIVAGIGMLALSLQPALELARLAPNARLRWRWRLLLAAIVAFAAGYLEHLFTHGEHHDRTIALVYFLGALFVLMVTRLMRRTARDILRIVELRRASNSDPLLGIYNRRYFDRRLPRELTRSRRVHDTGVALLLADIDHFKRVNDSHGHQAGDIVLRGVVEALIAAVRASDVVARFGGEEFAVIAPSADRSDAQTLAERVRSEIARHVTEVVSNDGRRVQVRVTISIGVALARAGDDPASLIRRADAALYEAKQTGRNRVVFAAEPGTEGAAGVAMQAAPSAIDSSGK